MHEMLTVVTDVGGVYLSVSLSVTLLQSAAARAVYAACCMCVCGGGGHSVHSYFDHLFYHQQ